MIQISNRSHEFYQNTDFFLTIKYFLMKANSFEISELKIPFMKSTKVQKFKGDII